MTERKYTTYDLMDEWKTMPAIPRDHNFKGISLDVLDSLGWRWDEPRNSYFIPYFSRSKTSIPFAQWRHLSGDRRFTMLKDAKPTCYGTWNLEPGVKLFVVEGASDCAVLEACAVPWIGLPSASSGELMVAMATFCKENNIQLLYAGDNDEAGDKLKAALESVMPYRVKQPPKQFKDWGEFFIAKGFDVVHQYCYDELFPKLPPMIEGSLEHINSIMPGSREISATDLGSSKETSSKPAVLF